MERKIKRMRQGCFKPGIIGGCLYFLSYPVFAEIWEFNDASAGLVIAHEVKTENEIFEGTKIILNGLYILSRKTGEISDRLKCCARPSHPEYFHGLLDAELHWGVDDSSLDFTSISITPWATKWEPEENTQENLRTEWDLLELGTVRFVSDEALEVESYLEFSFLRAARMGAYNWAIDSPFTVKMGMQTSIGWALAKSENTSYSKSSNPFAGVFFNLALEYKNWGEIYTKSRFVNGFSFSNPSRGHPTAREARARAGYLNNISRNLTLDIYGEKRSFYFNEGSLDGLYTKSGIFGAEIVYHWP